MMILFPMMRRAVQEDSGKRSPGQIFSLSFVPVVLCYQMVIKIRVCICLTGCSLLDNLKGIPDAVRLEFLMP